jgi:hypothetical protein
MFALKAALGHPPPTSLRDPLRGPRRDPVETHEDLHLLASLHCVREQAPWFTSDELRDKVLVLVSDLDWGNVPAWLGALSLILAYRVFMRDRYNAQRGQMDKLGAWATVAYVRRLPGASTRVEDGAVACRANLVGASPRTRQRPGVDLPRSSVA